MATARKLTEDFLTCPICTEVFQDPCTLQCEHTFCRSCLRRHIEAQPQVIQSESLVCPFCRRSTPVLGTDAPVEEWINSLKPSRLIGELMDLYSSKPGEIEHCTVCKDEGTTTLATVWCSECDSSLCESCLKIHQRMPTLRNHQLTGNWADMKSCQRKQMFICKEHDKKMKMFCKNCSQIMCTLCCALNHRQCTRVVTTQSMMPEVKQALQDKLAINSERIQEINTCITKSKLMFADKEDNCNKIKRDIYRAVHNTMKMLQDKKKQLVADVDEELQKQRDDLKAKVKLGEMDIQIYRQKAEFITQALERNSEADIFQMFQERNKIGDNTDVNWKRNVSLKSDVHFKHDLDKVELLISEMSIYSDSIDFSIPPILHTKHDCRIAIDKYPARLWDVLAVTVNGVDAVVVTDWKNASIKCFYKANNTSCYSILTGQAGPYCLALLEHHQAAATVPNDKQIIVFDIKPELVLTSTIKTTKAYCGLDFLKPTFVVSAPDSIPPSVDIVDITGTVVKSFTDLPSIQSSINSPYFVHVTSKGNILISDHGQKSLTCITPEGVVVFNYKPTDEWRLIKPRGITTTNDGDILLADMGLTTIVHLTETGDCVRDIPIEEDKLKDVGGLYMKESCLYVASFTENLGVFTYGVL